MSIPQPSWWERLREFAQNSRRLDIVARAVLAIFGSYGFAGLVTVSLSWALPMPPAQAVLITMMLSFALMCALAIWAFSAASAWRAWGVALLLAAIPAVHLLLKEILS
ncbi:hypothetical protein [Azomonas macrocytogenes]|uniref:Iron uptake protein n=1 Tax=Azomonas macrocytogenes TaxID=69962 RepID=A0A839T4C3_AZOMA|nr:hypothetical protein [Azomonas macrocytogenes]MBB3103849.1 hypothetical protein [Azomonas macrocytogenes]